jgi:AI-2E family transporter
MVRVSGRFGELGRDGNSVRVLKPFRPQSGARGTRPHPKERSVPAVAAAVIINVLDNLIKPLLIGRGAGVPIWVIFIGVIGGLLTIGFIGIFIGPLVMAAGYSIVMGWLSEDNGAHESRARD